MVGAGDRYQACEELIVLEGAVSIPGEWSGERVCLGLEFGGAETLVVIDGKPAQAIDSQHHDLLLADPAEGGRVYNLRLEAYTGSIDAQTRGSWTGAGDASITGGAVQVTLKTAELQCVDRSAEALFYDLSVAFQAAKTMDANSRQYVTIVGALERAIDLVDFSQGVKSDRYYASLPVARECIQENLYTKFHADKDFAPTLWATGHAHIDTAWLWRIAHSRKKIERTFTTALALMDEYPQYRFSASQPQQYAYLKEDNPDVYGRVKQAIERGQWEPVGAMWVESDCNVVSGESLVRQFLYGSRFFEKEFGRKTDVVWLPDVFGYCAAFPQIVKKSGMKYFMTIKIYWNQVNKPPYQTFEWEGIDGTTLLTHFSPLGGYNSTMVPEEWNKTWNEYQQKHLSDSALYIYGWGDGGGGPTRAMLETAERAADFPGAPKIKLSTNQEFFEDLDRQTQGNRMLPRWVGELYLEYHRGTYTSQGRIKRSNRQAEFLLQAAEQTASLALWEAGAAYPQEELERVWKLTLLNQFHDIIPGSSIRAVYEDSARDYEEILGVGEGVVRRSLSAIGDLLSARPGDVVLYNPLSWERSDVAEFPASLPLLGQSVTDLDGKPKTLVPLRGLPSLGYTASPAPADIAEGREDEALSASAHHLENQFFRLELDDNGEIVSLYDKRAAREVIDGTSYCKGNSLLTFEDKPLAFDAWDIDIFYMDKMTPIREARSVEATEQGPLRASVEVTRTFGAGSTVRQRISLWRDLARIDFDTEIDWRERQTLLKAAFPVNVHSPRATYDIQFGNVERPTHWNTSWDWARFEVCGHKWADLSEGDYGVSLLSDCKYGWDIKGNVMRLTLLKGGVSPDPDADLGRHRFAYALYPHRGDWRQAQTVRRAYEFNVPVQSLQIPEGASQPSNAAASSHLSFVSVDCPNVIVETVKKAEDEDALIVRLYEAHGQRGRVHLTFGAPVRSVTEVNLMERETDETGGDAPLDGARIALEYTPYEIKTLKVRR
ncbi:alpha-mannosidase [Capsulimonas corticalis]|uniref:alpha-mannosidase n=2 Tax=Capsulimonas corticalis TaxID=2219043 RepID=A0A402D6A2_9BACT|nr:alpha-mannosidase [Capsulimonas corticalis]